MKTRQVFYVVAGIMLGLVVAASGAYQEGEFWSLLNNNTVVLTDQAHNVHIGSNASTNSQLRVTGNVSFNGSVYFGGGASGWTSPCLYWESYAVSGIRPESSVDAVYLDSQTLFAQQGISTSSITGVGAVPIGAIIMWSGLTIPEGWALCNGTNGTPDLRGRFILGSNSTLALNATGGASTVTITNATMPAHYHTYNAFGTGTLITIGSGTRGQVTANTGTTGSGLPHSNLPPYYVLCFIMFKG